MSQNTPTVLFQDSRKFFWIGTQDGLNLYDGVTFTHFKKQPYNANSISDNLILCLFEDHRGLLWIGTEGGLNSYDRIENRFMRYVYEAGKPGSISSNVIHDIYQDSERRLWIATDNGLNLLDNNNGVFSHFSQDTPAGNNIFKIVESPKGELLLATNDGIIEFDRSNQSFIHKAFSKRKIRAIVFDKKGNMWAAGPDGFFKRNTQGIYTIVNQYRAINDLLIDKNGIIWIATVGQGVQLYNPEKDRNALQTYRNSPSDPYSLSGNDVIELFEDDAGIIWIGTNGYGINKYDPKKIKFNVYNQAKNKFADPVIRSVYQDHFGILWVGTMEGISRMNRQTGEVYNHLSNIASSCFLEDTTAKQIWMGTRNSGLYLLSNKNPNAPIEILTSYRANTNDINSLQSDHVRIIFKSKNGTLWIGTDKGGLAQFRPETNDFKSYTYDPNNPESLSNNRIRGIYEDNEGILWISTYGGGLNRFDPKTETFKAYKNDVNNPKSISTDRVYPVYQSDPQSIWVLTYGGGINKFNPQNEEFVHYTEEDGLPNNVVYDVLADDSGHLWLSTNRGLSRFNIKEKTFQNYTIDDGLQSNEFNAGAAFRNTEGELFFGGINGLNYFFPDSIRTNPYKAPIVFTNFYLFNRKVEIGDSTGVLQRHINESRILSLSHKQNSISIEFAALHYSSPEHNKYAYMLEGFETEWNYLNRGFAKYTNLDPGTYTFKAKGTNSDGRWNETPIIIEITITPPFYKEPWFVLTVVVSVIALFLLFYWLRVLSVERDKRLLEAKVQERTIELRKEKEKVEEKGQLLALSNKKVMDSIRYAQRIQDAIIPEASEIKEAIGENFVYYNPRDIVSGDFYWCTTRDNNAYLAVVDCTGHGVPGAFMSVIAFALLEQMINVRRLNDPARILEYMNKEIIQWLHQQEDTERAYKSRDGMDMSLLHIDFSKGQMRYAGAKNSLFVVSDNQIEEIKGDKFSIGGRLLHDKKKIFTNKPIKAQKGDMLYMTTDGFLDQFGGSEGRKFTRKRFKEKLLKIKELNLEEQHKNLKETFIHWKGQQRQIDDVLVVGIKI
ncbi:MAG: SpoIIE family protein phosphatase [Bernardetiaceae bacterium]|nr:SpoIIE family protein phosphatase [Bernardetiaceae bacterium]